MLSFHCSTGEVRLEYCRGFSKAQRTAGLLNFHLLLLEVAGKMSILNLLWPARCHIRHICTNWASNIALCTYLQAAYDAIAQMTDHRDVGSSQLQDERRMITACSKQTLKKSLSCLSQPRTNQLIWPLRGCRTEKDCYIQPHPSVFQHVFGMEQDRSEEQWYCTTHPSRPEAAATFETPLAMFLTDVSIIKER